MNLVGNTFDFGQNNQNTVYLSLLEKSLEKKAACLDELIELTAKQEALIAADQLEDEQFVSIIGCKSELIKKIDELDSGFEQLYQRVQEELKASPGAYRTQVERLKKLIAEVTDKGVKLEVMERRNKDKMDIYFRTKRDSIRSFKVNNRTAAKYYSSINNASINSTYFFDEKK